VLREALGKGGVDVVLDMVGGDYVPRTMEVMALEGRHVSIAFLRGAKTTVDLNAVMRKRLTLTGSTLRARPIADKAAIAEQLGEKVWPKIAAGDIRPLVHATYPLAQAAEAHALMESSAHIGKIMLSVRDGA
jgi:NADPH:quinone reductase